MYYYTYDLQVYGYIQANKKVDNLLGELNKSKQLGEKFQEVAEKAEESKIKLQEEFEKLRESVDNDTKLRLAKLEGKVSDLNQELEKRIAAISSEYKVHKLLIIYVEHPNRIFHKFRPLNRLWKLVKIAFNNWSTI